MKILYFMGLFALVLLSLTIASAQGMCQFAASASATSENPGSPAVYATGAPDAPRTGQCSGWNKWSGYGYTWMPTNWNVDATLTLTYDTPVYASNFTIFGDYDMCWRRMWVKNSLTGQEKQVFDGYDETCTSTKVLDEDFLADTIILETCGWSWSATDAVELCGGAATACGNSILEPGEECDDGNTADGDGCDSDCKIEVAPVCGNAVLEQGEECDDGNLINGDGCSDECKVEPPSTEEFDITGYGTPLESEYDTWLEFFQKVQVEGSGITVEGLVCLAAWITETRDVSLCKDPSGGEVGYNGITATGTDPKVGRTIAVDPSVIPLSSEVYIYFQDHLNEWDGCYIAEDTGTTIIGNKIDVFTGVGKAGEPLAYAITSTANVTPGCGTAGEAQITPSIHIVSPDQDAVLAPGTTQATLEIRTNEIAGCEYSTDSGFTFGAGTPFSDTGHFVHTALITVLDDTDYTYYYICEDLDGLRNPAVEHRFSVDKPEPVCGNSILEADEECDDGNTADGDGCDSDCKVEEGTEILLYYAPYVGDIDGNIDPDWFFFFDQLTQWHDDNSIPGSFSFYPRAIQDNAQFNQIIADMYLSENIELLHKGDGEGEELSEMSYEEVRALLEGDQNHFRAKMQEILGVQDIKLPVSYNQLYGKFTETIRDAIHSLGFKIYFEQYASSEYGHIDPLPDLDIMQYTVSFTFTGFAGPEEDFKPPEDIFQEILDFEHDHMLYINGKKVVSTMCHQQDFLVSENSNELNQEKWNTYVTVLQMAKADPRIELLTSEEIYDLRHQPPVCGNAVLEFGEECDDGNTVDGDGCDSECKIESSGTAPVCQFASSADATSENAGSPAIYATGAPDAPKTGECDGWNKWSGYGYTWTPTNWNVDATLTLTYDTPVYASNFTIFGDYDMCWRRMWIKNSLTGQEKQVFDGYDEACTSTKVLAEDFLADTIILETCGWSWSATDAVELCGASA